MEKNAEQMIRKVKCDITAYFRLRLELLKLDTYERVAKLVAVLSHGAILLLLAFFATLFLFLALGFFLGEQLNSNSLGFTVVAAIYLLLFFVILSGKNKIRQKAANIIIEAIMDQDAPNDEQQDNRTTCKTDGREE